MTTRKIQIIYLNESSKQRMITLNNININATKAQINQFAQKVINNFTNFSYVTTYIIDSTPV